MTRTDFIVIGAGQAGLAAGHYLQKAGADFLIVDGAAEVGGSWPRYYDSLELFSPFRYSALPGLPMPGAPMAYPRRDEVVRYLHDYAANFDLPVRLNTRVTAVERSDAAFILRAEQDDPLVARNLIVATGAFGAPIIPQLDGQEQFGGKVLHSADYRNPGPFRGQRVIVVGAGNSAVQIAVELADHADVTLAVRDKVRFLSQKVLGKDVHWWFDKLRLNRTNLFSDHGVPVIDDGRYRAALAANRPPTRAMFTAFTPDGVQWADGEHEAIDQVIFATGFKADLGLLSEMGALGWDGRPLHHKGISTTVRGLGYVGLSGQSGFASATLRGTGGDAEYVIKCLLHGKGKG